MPTAKQRAYARALADITRRFDRLDADTTRRIIAMLADLRKSIADALLTGGSDFETFRLTELQRNIGELISSFEAQAARETRQALNGANQLGALSVVEPLRAAGITGVFMAPTTAQANIAVDFSADLIRGITSEMLSKINNQLRIAALGNLSPFEAMKGITKILGVSGRAELGGIASKAEAILRTELGRLFNMASHSQKLVVAQQIPDTRKAWVATGDFRTRDGHLRAHIEYQANPIPVNEPYIVGGEEMMHPHDPAASAANTVNCRCTDITIHPDVGNFETPLDERIGAELDSRRERA